MGSLASVQTLLERYPTLTTTDSMLTNFSVNTSVGFLIDILSLLGITQADLVNWISKLLSGNQDGDGGLLLVIEHAIKAVLLANIKDMWSCSVDPILPDSLMKYSNAIFPDGTKTDPCIAIPTSDKLYKKIEIDLNQVDMFGILNNCPSDETGSIFYFDSYDSIYNLEGEQKPYYTPNNLWKSCDFNAYLWYVINKGTLSNQADLQYSCWDNRNKYVKDFKENAELRDAFFDIGNCTSSTVAPLQTIPIRDNDGNEVYKQQIILCEFNERPTPSADEGSLPSSNVLRVWLNANRYYHTRKIEFEDPRDKTKKITKYFNKTAFEFNYDYIYSLKLFDTKTLVSSIVNSLLGLSASVSASFSVQQKMIEAKVAAIVSRVIEEADDASSSDCYYDFSNDDYDTLMREAKENYSGVYQTNGMEGTVARVDADAILNELKNLKQSDNLIEQRSNIARTLENIMTIAASDPSVTDEFKFAFGLNFIKDFLQQTVTQIVMQVLTPKVAILYQINGAIMGGEANSLKSWEDFLKNFQNVLFNIIRQVKDIIVEELYKFVMDQIKPLIELVISKIALETVRYYKDLIEQLIKDCIPNFSLPNFSTNTSIDNVNYADITTEATPENIDKNC